MTETNKEKKNWAVVNGIQNITEISNVYNTEGNSNAFDTTKWLPTYKEHIFN